MALAHTLILLYHCTNTICFLLQKKDEDVADNGNTPGSAKSCSKKIKMVKLLCAV